MRSTPVARSISTRTSVPHIDVLTVPIRLLSVGGNFTLTRSMRWNLLPPLRTASASISARYCSPAIRKRARDQAQREKECATAPVTRLRACAVAASAGNPSGVRPGKTSCPSFHCAFAQSFARGSFGEMCQSSSAAGHNPKRKMRRAASADECVPTCAPIDALVAELIAGTQRGFFSARSCVFWSIV